jgi:hypothetical protein
VADDDLLAAGDDEAFVFPAAEDAADCVEGGAGHLAEILAREGEVDENTLLDTAPALAGEAEEGAGDAALDTLGCQLAVAELEVVEAAPDEVHAVQGEAGILLHEPADIFGAPVEAISVGDGFGGERVVAAGKGDDDADAAAGTDVADGDLVPVGPELHEAHLAFEDKPEAGGRLALLKEVSLAVDVERVGNCHRLAEGVVGQPLEQGRVADLVERGDGGHAGKCSAGRAQRQPNVNGSRGRMHYNEWSLLT